VSESLTSLGWFLLVFGGLVFFQRRLHLEIQVVLLLLTRRVDLTITLFSVVFLPGILIHEISHFLMAKLLGVRTGRISLIPKPLANGRLQLGFVETAPTDMVRDVLIGGTPLLVGVAITAYIGLFQLGFINYWNELLIGDFRTLIRHIPQLSDQPDFWLWFYLIFVVSSTMFPSPSDRRAWLPIAIIAGSLLGLVLIMGAGSWMLVHLAPPVVKMLRVLTVTLGISLSIHLVLLVLFFILRLGLSRLTGLRVGPAA
jgi:hypothetical protein